jgi:hypothetical protein
MARSGGLRDAQHRVSLSQRPSDFADWPRHSILGHTLIYTFGDIMNGRTAECGRHAAMISSDDYSSPFLTNTPAQPRDPAMGNFQDESATNTNQWHRPLLESDGNR